MSVTDPMAGHLVSKTKTRFGQTRPWMFSNPFGCVLFFILWLVIVPVSAELNGAKFAYYLIVYLLYCTLITCYHVPYTSSTMLIARKSSDIDAATAFRMSFELLGTIVGAGLFGFITTPNRVATTCGTQPTITEAAVENEKRAYMIGAAVIVLLYFLCGLAGSFGIQEKYPDTKVSHDSFFTNVKAVLTFRPYNLLMLAFLFMSLAVQMVQTNLGLYTTHSLSLGSHTSYGITCVLGIAILAIPMWNYFIGVFGKKNIFAFGIILFVPCLLCAMVVPKEIVWAYYLVMCFSGFAISISMLLPWSMLPDVIDDYYLKNGTRREASFYSLYVFFNKFAVGFSMAASQITMYIVGYDSSPEACEQSYEVGVALRYLVGPGPVVCLLLSLGLIYMYPIDKKYRQNLSEQLAELRQRQDLDVSKSSLPTSSESGKGTESSFVNDAYVSEQDEIQIRRGGAESKQDRRSDLQTVF